MRGIILLFLLTLSLFGAFSFLAFDKACEKDNAYKCHILGDAFLEGGLVRQDYAEAKRYYEKACSAGYAQSCRELADMYQRGLGVLKDAKKAQTYYQKAATLQKTDKTGTKNQPNYHALACEAGEFGACTTAEIDYLEGRGVIKNKKRALHYAMKRCQLLHDTCVHVGMLYEQGKYGLKRDFSKASTYYQKACQVQNAEGCYKLGNLYYYGKGVKQSYAKAFYYYKHACKNIWKPGVPEGCNNLAVLYEKGKGVKRNLKKARYYYQKACDFQYFPACHVLDKL